MTVSSTTTDNSYLDSLRTNSSTAAAASSTAGSDSIDQAGFLKLLTAQMTNQDPTAPMDSNTMVQQLSEMSTVSGITEMNTSMKSLVSELTDNRIGDAASWIGKAGAAAIDGRAAAQQRRLCRRDHAAVGRHQHERQPGR